MIKLNDRVHVAASQIAKVETPDHSQSVWVTLVGGERISVIPDSSGRFAKQDEILAAIDRELRGVL